MRTTISFLLKAQWLQQEVRAEGANETTIARLAARQAAGRGLEPGMTRADALLQARLDLISEELDERHSKASAAITRRQIAAYYAAHHAGFRNPVVRETLIVITRNRSTALAARAALAGGEPWAKVARRYSEESSAIDGGRYNVVEGIDSPSLMHAALGARRGAIVGPIGGQPAALPTASKYYLFKVIGGHPGSQKSLSVVSGEIKATLEQEADEHALQAFDRSYERRWRARTLCAPDYIVPECRNYASGSAAG